MRFPAICILSLKFLLRQHSCAMQKIKRRALFFLGIAIVLMLSAFLAVNTILGKINHCYDCINDNMSILEVRRLLNGSFCESDVPMEQIEKEGYLLDHLVSIKQGFYAKKYAYHICKPLYFYVIYDGNDRVQLTIPAFE